MAHKKNLYGLLLKVFDNEIRFWLVCAQQRATQFSMEGGGSVNKERMVQVAFRVPVTMKQEIESIARRLLATPSQFVRASMAAAIRKAGRK